MSNIELVEKWKKKLKVASSDRERKIIQDRLQKLQKLPPDTDGDVVKETLQNDEQIERVNELDIADIQHQINVGRKALLKLNDPELQTEVERLESQLKALQLKQPPEAKASEDNSKSRRLKCGCRPRPFEECPLSSGKNKRKNNFEFKTKTPEHPDEKNMRFWAQSVFYDAERLKEREIVERMLKASQRAQTARNNTIALNKLFKDAYDGYLNQVTHDKIYEINVILYENENINGELYPN